MKQSRAASRKKPRQGTASGNHAKHNIFFRNAFRSTSNRPGTWSLRCAHHFIIVCVCFVLFYFILLHFLSSLWHVLLIRSFVPSFGGATFFHPLFPPGELYRKKSHTHHTHTSKCVCVYLNIFRVKFRSTSLRTT